MIISTGVLFIQKRVIAPNGELFYRSSQGISFLSFLDSLCSLLLGNSLYKPFHALLQALFGDSGACLNCPCSILDGHKRESFQDLFGIESELQVLLVGEDQ